MCLESNTQRVQLSIRFNFSIYWYLFRASNNFEINWYTVLQFWATFVSSLLTVKYDVWEEGGWERSLGQLSYECCQLDSDRESLKKHRSRGWNKNVARTWIIEALFFEWRRIKKNTVLLRSCYRSRSPKDHPHHSNYPHSISCLFT